MQAKYIYRMDDITPDMNWKQFWNYLDMFSQNNVVPLTGIVPDNCDPELSVGKSEPGFWKIIRELALAGRIQVAQHGYRHKIEELNAGGVIRKSIFSEFAGFAYDEQYRRINEGKKIMMKHGIFTDIWMAPRHSYDDNTLRALKDLGFRYVTDGTALTPFSYKGLIFVPQQLWRPRDLGYGIFTICLHTNTEDEALFNKVKKHVEGSGNIISFYEAAEFKTGIKHILPNKAFKLLYSVCRLLRKFSRR